MLDISVKFVKQTYKHDENGSYENINALVWDENVSFLCSMIVEDNFTFLAICLVGTVNKAMLSRKADMRLQLRSFVWHGVMVVRWTHRQNDVKMDEWKCVGEPQNFLGWVQG